MIQYRIGSFETNSSSANVLIIPKSQCVRIPKRFIFVDDETSMRASEKVLHSLLYNRDNIDKVINFMYLSGVEEIVYGGRDSNIERAIEKYKNHPQDMGFPVRWGRDKLTLALFGVESEVEHFRDGESRPNYGPGPEYKQLDEDEENYYEEYYSDD